VARRAGASEDDPLVRGLAARLSGIGVRPEDDDELRQKKTLAVLLAVLVLPVSLVWGSLYLGFGSAVGFVPFIYFAVSVGSLVLFARTGNFRPFLVTQLLDVMLTTTIGQMLIGGFLPRGASRSGAAWLRSARSCSSRSGRPFGGSWRS
jgi:hypothetical protein